MHNVRIWNAQISILILAHLAQTHQELTARPRLYYGANGALSATDQLDPALMPI